MGCLYKLTSPSGKSYIGISSKTMEIRWAKHIEHALGKRDAGILYNALRKYGPGQFKLELLAEESNWEKLCTMEKAAIQEQKTLAPFGYNIALGGEGVQGKRSLEVRLKISAAQKKRFQRPDELKKLRQLGQRAKHSINWINAQKTRCHKKRCKPKRLPLSREQWHARLMESMSDPHTKRRTQEAAKARWASFGFREKYASIRKGRKTRPCTEERKAKISLARKREWTDPIIRAKRLAGLVNARKMTADLSVRRRISESVKKLWNDPEYRSKALIGLEKARAAKQLS